MQLNPFHSSRIFDDTHVASKQRSTQATLKSGITARQRLRLERDVTSERLQTLLLYQQRNNSTKIRRTFPLTFYDDHEVPTLELLFSSIGEEFVPGVQLSVKNLQYWFGAFEYVI